MRILKLTFRNLRRNMLYSFINIAGLAISLTAVIFIVLWVQDELSYDSFHENVDNKYIVVVSGDRNGQVASSDVTQGFITPAIKERFGEVESFCRVRGVSFGFVKYGDKKLSAKRGFLADSTFFSFFSFPIVKGQQTNLLQNSADVVISEQLSEQLFGSENPVGKVISIENKDMQVAAVMKNIPQNTLFYNTDIICPYTANIFPYYLEALDEMGYGAEYLSFIQMHPGADMEAISAKITTEAKTMDPEIHSIWFQPIANRHLHTVNDATAGILVVRSFMLVAVIILVIACINYVSLITARATRRAREIGLKKIVGAQKYQLFVHLLLEAVVMFAIAICVAVVLVVIFLPLYNQLSGKQLVIDWLAPNVWLILGGSLFATTVIAGIYPTVLLTSYKPLSFMRGEASKSGSGSLFRKVLVVVQFCCSIVFIIATITLNIQMKYIREKNLGYDKEHIFTVSLYNAASHFDAVKAELMQHSSILGVTAASENITYISSGHYVPDWEGKTSTNYITVVQERIDTSFINVMGIPLIAGKGFTSGYKTEYIFNEAAIKAMGMEDPIGKRIDFGEPGTIVGVVNDFHYTTLHEPIHPLIMYWDEELAYLRMFIRTTAKDAADAVATVEKVWNKYNPDHTFTYTFIDESFNNRHRSDLRLSNLLVVFTVIAILISCLGLFGLATYTAETRVKEIGIRKTLGASIINIVALLSKEFVVLVGIAILVAFPLGYYLLNLLLQSYSYRIGLSWWIFVLTALAAIALIILTISGQALRAARTNPVKAIKTE